MSHYRAFPFPRNAVQFPQMAGPLKNPRHEKFCTLVATGINLTEAYISVGYSENGAKGAAFKLRQKADICSRITDLVAAAEENRVAKAEFNRTRVLNRLDVLSRQAQAAGQFSAAARCEELIGRAEGGMFVDRTDSTVKWNGDLSGLDSGQLAKLTQALEQIAFRDDPAGLEEWRRGEEQKPPEPPQVQ
jgi:hypothetical protein